MSTHPPPGQDAPAGDASSGDRVLQRGGRDLVFALYSAVRTLRIYPLENQAIQNALTEVHQIAQRILEGERALSLRYVGDFVFINDLRLKIDLSSFATIGALGRVLRQHGLGELQVLPGVTREEWTAFLSLLLAEPGTDPFARFQERLVRTAVTHLVPGPDTEDESSPRDPDYAKESAKRTYAQTVAVAREAIAGARMGKSVSMRRVKRAVQSIVDQVMSNETSITGMTTLRDYDEYTFTHCVNVCIFSITLGKKLGLEKHELYELGLGALLHDVGKARMPHEITNKPGPLDARELERMREHTIEGLLALFTMHGFAQPPLRAMLSVYEHHLKTDLTGYPRVIRPRDPTLFPRIVAVADAFDAATTKRSYQSEPWVPEEALREMRDNPDRGLDPLLVKAFISVTGIYPVGTVVVLDSYELAVVVASNPRPDALHRPIVRILYDGMGRMVDPPLTVDLAEPEAGQPSRTIIKTTDPERYGINVGSYFL